MNPLFPFLMASASAEEVISDGVNYEVEAAPTYWQEMVEKFAETPATTWIAVLVIVLLGAILLLAGKTRKQWTAKTVAYAALAISLSFVLSLIRLYRMPSGGSVTPASMLPVMLFAAAFGMGPGLLAGAVLGVLQYLQGGWFLNVWQFLLDYVLAYAALGLCGLYKPMKQKPWGIYAAMIIAVLARLVSATLAGYMFWDTAFWASVVYNGFYLVPDTAICILLAIPLHKPVLKILSAK